MTPNTAPAAINAEQAWDITTGSASIVVAVLDTGIRFDHPDLQGGNILAGYDMISEDGDGTFTTANDGDGRDADASDPGDFVAAGDAGKGGCTAADVGDTSSWHGTETAGLIGATTDNGIGMASVGRGNVRILPVRVLGKCGGYDSDIVAGMLWAAGIRCPASRTTRHPARVINMSLGGVGACTPAYTDAVRQVNAAGRRRRRVGRQQRGPRGQHPGQLPRRDRRRRAAPHRHQGRLLRSRAGDLDRRAGRQLRQHHGRHAVPLSDHDDVERRHDDAGGRRGRLDLQRRFNARSAPASRRRSSPAPPR